MLLSELKAEIEFIPVHSLSKLFNIMFDKIG